MYDVCSTIGIVVFIFFSNRPAIFSTDIFVSRAIYLGISKMYNTNKSFIHQSHREKRKNEKLLFNVQVVSIRFVVRQICAIVIVVRSAKTNTIHSACLYCLQVYHHRLPAPPSLHCDSLSTRRLRCNIVSRRQPSIVTHQVIESSPFRLSKRVLLIFPTLHPTSKPCPTTTKC